MRCRKLKEQHGEAIGEDADDSLEREAAWNGPPL
jgi:hypothetical protein